MARILTRISPSSPPSCACVASACSTDSAESDGIDAGVFAFEREQQLTETLLGHRGDVLTAAGARRGVAPLGGAAPARAPTAVPGGPPPLPVRSASSIGPDSS